MREPGNEVVGLPLCPLYFINSFHALMAYMLPPNTLPFDCLCSIFFPSGKILTSIKIQKPIRIHLIPTEKGIEMHPSCPFTMLKLIRVLPTRVSLISECIISSFLPWRTCIIEPVTGCNNVSVCTSLVAHTAGAYPGLHSMKRLGVLLLLLDGMLVRQYPFILLGGEGHHESKVSCPKTQHHDPARAQTRTSRCRVQRTNH